MLACGQKVLLREELLLPTREEAKGKVLEEPGGVRAGGHAAGWPVWQGICSLGRRRFQLGRDGVQRSG